MSYFLNVDLNVQPTLRQRYAPVNINPRTPGPETYSGELGFICLANDLIHQ